MKKIVATSLAAIAAALTLGSWQPAQAETRCWRSGNHVQCQNVQPNRDYNRYNHYNSNPHNYNYNYRTYRPHNNYNYSYNYRTYRPYNNYNNYNYSYNYRTYRPYNNYNNYRYNSYNSDLARAINQIYRQELGRNVDGDGLRHYINQYYNGWSLGQIRRDIANSQEAYNLRAGYY
jgi:hypothetical protein